jgi:1-deoxy-D-xylulose-5-phosphate reductoisomerase
MKVLSILGSTGSIGTNALRVTAGFPEAFRVVGLAGGRNAERLAAQVISARPKIVSCQDHEAADRLYSLLRRQDYPLAQTRLVCGPQGTIEVACHPEVSLVVSAISGAAGLVPTFRALESGKSVALANKEALVMAGQLMMDKAREKGTEILPVDSEHNAIHQCLRGGRRNEVRRLILTAS